MSEHVQACCLCFHYNYGVNISQSKFVKQLEIPSNEDKDLSCHDDDWAQFRFIVVYAKTEEVIVRPSHKQNNYSAKSFKYMQS